MSDITATMLYALKERIGDRSIVDVMDYDKDGIVIKAEFRKYLNGANIEGWSGLTANDKTDIVDNFWNTMDTNQTIRTDKIKPVGTNKYYSNLNALDSDEVDAINQIISGAEAPEVNGIDPLNKLQKASMKQALQEKIKQEVDWVMAKEDGPVATALGAEVQKLAELLDIDPTQKINLDQTKVKNQIKTELLKELNSHVDEYLNTLTESDYLSGDKVSMRNEDGKFYLNGIDINNPAALENAYQIFFDKYLDLALAKIKGIIESMEEVEKTNKIDETEKTTPTTPTTPTGDKTISLEDLLSINSVNLNEWKNLDQAIRAYDHNDKIVGDKLSDLVFSDVYKNDLYILLDQSEEDDDKSEWDKGRKSTVVSRLDSFAKAVKASLAQLNLNNSKLDAAISTVVDKYSNSQIKILWEDHGNERTNLVVKINNDSSFREGISACYDNDYDTAAAYMVTFKDFVNAVVDEYNGSVEATTSSSNKTVKVTEQQLSNLNSTNVAGWSSIDSSIVGYSHNGTGSALSKLNFSSLYSNNYYVQLDRSELSSDKSEWSKGRSTEVIKKLRSLCSVIKEALKSLGMDSDKLDKAVENVITKYQTQGPDSFRKDSGSCVDNLIDKLNKATYNYGIFACYDGDGDTDAVYMVAFKDLVDDIVKNYDKL